MKELIWGQFANKITGLRKKKKSQKIEEMGQGKIFTITLLWKISAYKNQSKWESYSLLQIMLKMTKEVIESNLNQWITRESRNNFLILRFSIQQFSTILD